MRFAHLACILAAAGGFYGCSLINAPDDVVPDDGGMGATGATGATDATGGEPGPGTGGNDGVGGEVGSGGTDVGTAGQGTGGEDGGVAAPTSGLVVVGAQVGPDASATRVLSALSGRTGAEIIREDLPVAGLAYDEAPGRHVFFVFTSSNFPASRTGTADLEVRRFDDVAGEWSVLGNTTALPPPLPDQFLVLNERLLYLSHRVVNGVAVSAVTLLDTSDLENVTELSTRTAVNGETYVGLVGSRGSDVNPDAPGGRVRLMITRDCSTDCELIAQQVFVGGSSLTDGTSVTVDRVVGQPRFVQGRLDDRLYAAFRSTSPDRLEVRSYQGAELTNPVILPIAGFSSQDVGGFDLVECSDAGVLTDPEGAQLVAFHVTSGMQQVFDLMHDGGPVYTEPFGPSVITLDSVNALAVRSFDVSRSGTMNVAINLRSTFQAPADLVPQTGATRRGESLDCP